MSATPIDVATDGEIRGQHRTAFFAFLARIGTSDLLNDAGSC
jgi:hypothetical protein